MNKLEKIGVISLGCDKNRVDTETILFLLEQAGYIVTGDEDDVDIVIINTCAFIESAKVESIDTIMDFVSNKVNSHIKIIVCGCLAVRYAQDLMDSIPEIDAVVGFRDYNNIIQVIEGVLADKKMIMIGEQEIYTTDRVLSTPYHYAYLKIADGCDNHCTYCAIPSIRGHFRSRNIDSLVVEAQKIITQYGIKELILVAQDVTRYGYDIYGEYKIVELIQALSKLNIKWIRLLYCYPELVSDELIYEVATNPKVAKYIDIPLQHADTRVLKRMNRRVDAEKIVELISKIRSANSDIAIRSTFITGFPAETEEEFDTLEQFISDTKLDYAGFFAYSQEEGTPAYRMKGQLDEELKEERRARLYELQNNIIMQNNKRLLGSTVEVLYEDIDYDRNLFVGRSQQMAPDIDINILFTSKSLVNVGESYLIKITGCVGLDLIGEVVE